MKATTFKYFSKQTKLILFIFTGILLAVAIILAAIVPSFFFDFGWWIILSVFLLLLAPFFYFLICIDITFETDKIIYKTPFKKIIIDQTEIQEIVWLINNAENIYIDIEPYNTETKEIYGKKGMSILIGKTNRYPSTFFYRKSNPSYITIEYREELSPFIDYYYKQILLRYISSQENNNK